MFAAHEQKSEVNRPALSFAARAVLWPASRPMALLLLAGDVLDVIAHSVEHATSRINQTHPRLALADQAYCTLNSTDPQTQAEIAGVVRRSTLAVAAVAGLALAVKGVTRPKMAATFGEARPQRPL